MLRIERTGPLCTVQDLGRVGWGALAVPRSGAFDRAALRLANRLVGNPEGAAGLEIVLGGLHLRTEHAVTLALTGAPCPGLAWGAAVSLPAGAAVRLGSPAVGLRSYLSVRGGLDVPSVLGSRSTDTLSGLGPAPLKSGDRLAVGAPGAGPVPGVEAVLPAHAATTVLRARPGPRHDWFTAPALDRLFAQVWSVRPDCDRIGVRLDGAVLERAVRGELPSEATLPGGLQVPGDGRPILFGPDCPVTGGYPVIAAVLEADLDRAAQLRPGDTVRLRRA